MQLRRSLPPLHISSETGLGHAIDHLIARIASFQTRVLATLVIVAVASLIAFYAAPYAVRETDEFIQQFTTEDSMFRSFVPPRLVLRTVQFSSLFAASILLLLVWGYVEIATDIATQFNSMIPQIKQIGGTVVLLVVLVLSADLAKSRIRGLSEESDRVGEHEESVLIRVTNLTIAVTVGLALLSLWIEDVGSLLVGAGFLGIVFGMAARQILAAALSGFVLMFSRPFEVGDWVKIGDAEGTVMDISLMHSHLRSFDGETVVIPNDEVEASTVINRTDRGRLRLEVDVGVGYESDLDRAEEIALEAVESVENVLEIPSPEVLELEFADSSVVLRLRFWIDNPSARRKWQTRADVINAVKAAFDEEGIDIPFPQREVAGETTNVAAPEAMDD